MAQQNKQPDMVYSGPGFVMKSIWMQHIRLPTEKHLHNVQKVESFKASNSHWTEQSPYISEHPRNIFDVVDL